ncbi:hypothetical protein BV898_11067 [Hypsibius exemplaris]|uniref:Uncharacterized protein n=1 Tax=Hypsibius exemplaris TaxID=2072580 RepID=A0A1W0WHK9_HYPEX|nr:hypothetical protein BV898_11067 [Hypsibius exemplaris]
MVQLFYYEQRGKNCRKILNYKNGRRPSKIFLYPDESYVKSGLNRHWILKTTWWSRNHCRIIEVIAGVARRETKGRIFNHAPSGVMFIQGRFKAGDDDDGETPDFCMKLTSEISAEDFRAGYSMTGILEQGNFDEARSSLTHYAMIKRHDML